MIDEVWTFEEILWELYFLPSKREEITAAIPASRANSKSLGRKLFYFLESRHDIAAIWASGVS